MSLIWFIVVNTIIGLVLFPVMAHLIEWYVDKKYGISILEETIEENEKKINDFCVLKGFDNRIFSMLFIGIEIVLWEIFYPMIIVQNLNQVKDLHEVRGGNDRLIIRKKDRKEQSLKADFEYANALLEVLNKNFGVDMVLMKLVYLERRSPESEEYKIAEMVIKRLMHNKKLCEEYFEVTKDHTH